MTVWDLWSSVESSPPLRNQKPLHLEAERQHITLQAYSTTKLNEQAYNDRLTFNIAMQFSQIVSLVLAAATRSGIKLRHLTGHSCFNICILSTDYD